MTQEKTKEELQGEINYWVLEYENLKKLNRELDLSLRQTAGMLLDFQNQPKLNLKQAIVLDLLRSVPLTAPGYFKAAEQWDRAEELYEEGVKRGHFPK